VLDGKWTEFTLPPSGDELAVVNVGAVHVSFDQDLVDGATVDTSVPGDAFERAAAGAAPTYRLGQTARATKVFVAGNGADTEVCLTLTRGKD
jgi:hypothetical protein